MDYREVYGWMHKRYPNCFSGYSIKPHVDDIAALIRDYGATRLLDYGSGKGMQYLVARVHEQWGGLLPVCYDLGIKQLSKKPQGKFDGIICTDVMGYIQGDDVPGVLADIFGYADQAAWVFFFIACCPAENKYLPNGRDVQLTAEPPEWWSEQLAPFNRTGLMVKVVYDEG